MPGSNFPYTQLDYEQVIKQVYDESTDRLRTDSTFSGTISVHLTPSTDGVYIGDGTDVLKINPDGSIDVNLINPIDVNISAASGDSILTVGTEDGTTSGTQHVLKIDSNLNTNVINMGVLVPKIFDEVVVTNSIISGQTVPTTIVYKSLTSTVATLTVTYDGTANVTHIVRT